MLVRSLTDSIRTSFCVLKALNEKHWHAFVALLDSSHPDQKQVDWFIQHVCFPKRVESFRAECKPVVTSLFGERYVYFVILRVRFGRRDSIASGG